jgi:hypothetical protein
VEFAQDLVQFFPMLGRQRVLYCSRLVSVTESVVSDIQKASASPRTTCWTRLLDRAVKNLTRLTSRQQVVLLHSLSRRGLSAIPEERRLVHRISMQLSEHIPHLSLKEIALAVNAFAKMGIKNEVFLTHSMDVVRRRLNGLKKHSTPISAPTTSTIHPSNSVALILSGYSKLGVESDLFQYVFDECVPLWLCTMNELDAVSFLNVAIRSGVRLREESVVDSLVSLLSSPDLMITGLSLVAKSADSKIPKLSIVRLVRGLSCLPDLTTLDSYKVIQGFHGLSSVPTVPSIDLIRWFNEAGERIVSIESTSDKQTLGNVVVFLSAIGKSAEKLSRDDTVAMVKKIESKFGPHLDIPGMSVLVNTMASLDLPIWESTRRVLSGIVSSPLPSHAFGVLCLSLMQLDEISLVARLLTSPHSPRDILRSSSIQSIDSILFATVWLRDRVESFPEITELLARWTAMLDPMVGRNRFTDQPVASRTQHRIIRALRRQGELEPIESFHGASNIVSRFHREVCSVVETVVDERVSINIIDRTTGYEMDILLE